MGLIATFTGANSVESKKYFMKFSAYVFAGS